MARVLIVDADAEVREVLAYLLSRQGFCVRSANQADAALRMAQAEPPAALVTALRVEPIDGVELIQQLRLIPACAALPAVIFTALTRHDVLERMGGELLPGVVLLQKGDQPRRVVEEVTRLLSERGGGDA